MQRILIIGCGDIALRVAALLRPRHRVLGLIRDPAKAAQLRAAGIVPVIGDLDAPTSLGRLAGLADCVLHFAPPPNKGRRDPRTGHLLNALTKGEILPQRLVYISTSGVYGDCGGSWVDETRTPRPSTDRARRRVDAERQIRAFGRRSGAIVSILRVPGIYAAGRLPEARIRAGLPALLAAEDGYTNHVHADDLARAAVAALYRGRNGRVYNVVDDDRLRMADYFDAVADHLGLPRPPRLPREQAAQQLSAAMLSFMDESRRLSNLRARKALRWVPRYPTVADGIAHDSRLPAPR